MRFSEEALELLKHYNWPGNIRELANVVAFTTTMAESEIIEVSDLPPKLRDLSRPTLQVGGQSFYDQVSQFESKLLSDAYSQQDGNISKMALKLGMDRSHLYTKLKEYGIHPPRKNKLNFQAQASLLGLPAFLEARYCIL